MQELKKIIDDIGISKVRLAKYLGVSRQMLYNYLALSKIEELPKEKATRLFGLLGIENEIDLDSIKIDGNYIIEVEGRLNEGVRDSSEREVLTDLRNFNKKEQELLTDIINLLKEKLMDDNTKTTFNAYTYLYHYLIQRV